MNNVFLFANVPLFSCTGSDQRLQIGCRTFLGSLVLHPLLRQLVGSPGFLANRWPNPKPATCPRFVISGGSGNCADDHEAMQQKFNGRTPKF